MCVKGLELSQGDVGEGVWRVRAFWALEKQGSERTVALVVEALVAIPGGGLGEGNAE